MTDPTPSLADEPAAPPPDVRPSSIGFRQVLRLALPITVANLSQPVVGFVGTWIAGHLPGSTYLAGVALGSAFLNLVFWNFAFLRKTTAGLTAQAFGARDRQEQSDTLWRALAIALATGVILLALTPAFVAFGLPLLGGTEEVQSIAAIYVTIRLAAAAPVFGNMATFGYLVGIQRSGLALVAQTTASLTHIGLPVLLVLGLDWGIPGLALAAVAGDAIGFAAGMLLAGAQGLRRPGPSTLRISALRRLLAANTDMFARSLCLTFALAWFTRAGAREGTAVLAANALLLNFQSFLGFVVEGFASAAQTLIGAGYGARNRPMVLAAFRIAGQWTTGLAVAFAAGYAFYGTALIAALTDQQDTAAAAARYLPWMIAGPLAMAWAFLLDGVFLGATRTRDLRNSMVASVGSFIVLAGALQPVFGNDGLWAAYVLMMTLRAATLGWALRRQPLGAFPAQAAWT